jgi:hypothetical protein
MRDMVYADITAVLDVDSQTRIVAAPTVEVALDCGICQRTARTIILSANTESLCRSTRHPFPGRITSHHVDVEHGQAIIRYRIAYQTWNFIDPKREEPSVLHPTWGRVTMQVTCPGCKSVVERSIQNNSYRPDRRVCECGTVLFTEQAENPQFQVFDVAGQTLYHHTISRYMVTLPPTADLSPALIRALATALHEPHETISERIAQNQPLYEQPAFSKTTPADFSLTLQAIVFLLLRSDIDFDVTGYGRSLKSSYARCLSEQDAEHHDGSPDSTASHESTP